MSLPAVAESLFGIFAGMIDTKMVSALGVIAISAVAVTNQPRLFIFGIFFALNITVSAIVARLYGKQEQRKACDVFITSLMMVLGLSALFALPCVFFANEIIDICSGQGDTHAMSVGYFRIVMGFMFINMVYILINSVLRGCGYTKVTLTSNVVGSLVNILGNWLLISGHWGFPALGVNGAAIATVVSSAVACCVSFYMLSKQKFFVNVVACFKLRARCTKEAFFSMLGMWRDITAENILTRIGFLFSSMICARIGAFDMAVYSVGMILMNVSFAFGNGFLSSTVALVGRSLGEGIRDKILLYCKYIQSSGFLCSMVLGLLYILGGRFFFGFFNEDPDFLFKGMAVCAFIGAIGPFQVSQLIYNGVLKSMGKTRITLVAAVVSVTVVNPILAFLLVIIFHTGIWGIWISILVSQIVRYVMLRHSSRKALDELAVNP